MQPYSDEDMWTQIFMKPIMRYRYLQLKFRYQDEETLYDTCPGRFLSQVIGHEGSGSILAYLMKKGWASGL